MDTTQTVFDTSNFWTVNWYYLVALTVSIIGIIIAYKNFRKSQHRQQTKQILAEIPLVIILHQQATRQFQST